MKQNIQFDELEIGGVYYTSRAYRGVITLKVVKLTDNFVEFGNNPDDRSSLGYGMSMSKEEYNEFIETTADRLNLYRTEDEVLSIFCDAREIAKTDIKNRFSGLTKDETINLLAKKLYLELEASPDEYGDKDRQLGVMDFLNEEFIKNKWWNLLVDKDRG